MADRWERGNTACLALYLEIQFVNKVATEVATTWYILGEQETSQALLFSASPIYREHRGELSDMNADEKHERSQTRVSRSPQHCRSQPMI